jgi:hypothetical protein
LLEWKLPSLAVNVIKYKEKFQTLTLAKVAAYGAFTVLFIGSLEGECC